MVLCEKPGRSLLCVCGGGVKGLIYTDPEVIDEWDDKKHLSNLIIMLIKIGYIQRKYMMKSIVLDNAHTFTWARDRKIYALHYKY